MGHGKKWVWKQSKPNPQFSTVWTQRGATVTKPFQTLQQSKLEEPPTGSGQRTAVQEKRGGAGERRRSAQGDRASRKGCLIHLSGVVKGLAADNSVEC